MQTRPYFQLVFRPNISLVSTVRRFAGEFYRRVLVDQELTSRLALATHELLENAVTYSSDQETAIRIDIEDEKLIIIRTWNRANPDRIEAVKTNIDRVMAAPDSELYYQEQMRIAAKRNDGSGLGLARVRNEAELNLNYEIENDKICIRAVAKIVGGLNP
jgi:anti-sigma regulatory factor (Ser/Thr protein kinase)